MTGETYLADELGPVFDHLDDAADGIATTAERDALERLARATHFARDLALQREFPTPTQKLWLRAADDVDELERPPDPRPWTEYEPPAGDRTAGVDLERTDDPETVVADELDPVFDRLDDARGAAATAAERAAVDRVERATHFARDLALQREFPTPNQKLFATVADGEVEKPPRPESWEGYEPPAARGTTEGTGVASADEDDRERGDAVER